jgi:hypothetical protein
MRLVDVSSTQCPRNPLGFPTNCQINSCSSSLNHCVQGPAESHSIGHLRYVKLIRTKELVDYRLFTPKELSSQLHVPSTLLFIPAYHLFCHDRTGTPPYEFARRVANKSKTSQDPPYVYCPVADIRVSTRTRIGPVKRQDIVVRIATSSRSSFIKPLRSRTSGVAFCRTSTLR